MEGYHLRYFVMRPFTNAVARVALQVMFVLNQLYPVCSHGILLFHLIPFGVIDVRFMEVSQSIE